VTYGDKGSLNWRNYEITLRGGEKIPSEKLQSDYMASLSDEEKERLFPRGIINTESIELKEFFDAIQGKAEIEVNGEEGMKDVAICMALYESAWCGKEMRIADVENCKIEGYQEELNRDAGLL
jgi:predicted dehydrogenase